MKVREAVQIANAVGAKIEAVPGGMYRVQYRDRPPIQFPMNTGRELFPKAATYLRRAQAQEREGKT